MLKESGLIGKDGLLRLPMERVREYCRAHPGQRVIVSFQAIEPGTTYAQKAYYLSYCVPTIREALYKTGERKTDEQTDYFLRSMYGQCYNDAGDLAEIDEMSRSEVSDFIDWLKQFAAENLSVYVEDARTI